MGKFRVGIIGYGWVAGAHIEAINALPEAEVNAVVSARPLDGAELSARHGSEIRVYSRVKEMLANPEIDVVSICSYPNDHARQAVTAAGMGCMAALEAEKFIAEHEDSSAVAAE